MSADLQALVRSGRLRRADAALGGWIARAFPDSHPDVALAAAMAARAVADGHSALRLDTAQAWLANLDGRGETPVLPDAVAWQAALRASDAVRCDSNAAEDEALSKPLVLDAQGRVYLARYFGYERRLAQDLVARAQADRLKLVTGGPGTGKTHGVVRTLAALAGAAHAASRSLRIALAAPTGKAAARLAESVRAQLPGLALPAAAASMIPRDASTLHRLLGLSPASTRAQFHRGAPLPHDVVVVDEVSMVDLPLMAKLADAVREDATLILLGDPDQLAAVEAGDVLGALVDAAREPPLSHCHAHLTRSRRFDEHGALGRLANAIAAGDAESALAAFDVDDEVQLFTDDARGARLLDQAVDAYQRIRAAPDAATALRVADGFRVLTARRHGSSGNLALDRAIEQRLKRHAGVRADTPWWQGRLLMVTVNRAELGLFNGDVGVVWPDADGAMKVWFQAAEGALRAISPAALPPHEGAFALTVHKAQGSEFERVALVTGPDSAVLTRELLYTGVTRARSAVALHSTPEVLRAGIARRTLRWNGLTDRLREAAGT
ncbi:MAG: Exodeoxyribonuclease V alpha chain [Rhodanobacteraceae bacterium]|jgi:exodeoxyribonuclease V alpha subunit|nr:MAG: Exodeoxyribonuclease V alpha chain [Rhodanobacteraceae bacterium]